MAIKKFSSLMVFALLILPMISGDGVGMDCKEGVCRGKPECNASCKSAGYKNGGACVGYPDPRDDLLIFVEGSFESVAGVFTVLSQFEKLSGLAVNISKTSMFCSGVSDEVLDQLRNRFSLFPGSLPIRYLGLPLCSRKLTISDCDPLLQQIRTKLNGWMHRHLSLAGRLTLIATVISGIIGFWTAAFFLPKKVIRKVNSLCSSFLWHGSLDGPSSAKVSWSSLSYPKSEAGLGIKSILEWNDTCGLKLIWMLFFRAGSIWVAWIRSRYLSRSCFWSLNEDNQSFSWMFRRLLKLRHKAVTFLRILIGNGEETYFWWDPWTPFGPLIHFLGPQGPASLGIPLFSLVMERLSPAGWCLPAARSEIQLQLFSFITTISYSNVSDVAQWLVGDKVCKSFSSKVTWDNIRNVKPHVSWHPLRACTSSDRSLALLQGWQAAIYEIWKERNRRFHDGATLSPSLILQRIFVVVKNKSIAMENLGSGRGEALLRIWSSI
ncbi:unnamed protein product [Arabis nemorensis]|uniref:Reverse transcriptase domain-containing protein n=1 Tax=Arabis nemorensis TaxID=586526 RepID=A0A565AN81_9BRAS|nr:unnamed protein product [Arabis nemorensis]